ncbi:hypothetical protein GCM10027589_38750 [Actinocorallia lasiicapitis]
MSPAPEDTRLDPDDADLFRWFLDEQERTAIHGDLLELGADTGLLQKYARDDEQCLIGDRPDLDPAGLRATGAKHFRFVHLSSRRSYEEMTADLAAARVLIRTGGIAAVGGFCDPRHPATAAALWGAVLEGGLRPICAGTTHLYGTWSDPVPFQNALLEWIAGGTTPFLAESHPIAPHRLIKVLRRA